MNNNFAAAKQEGSDGAYIPSSWMYAKSKPRTRGKNRHGCATPGLRGTHHAARWSCGLLAGVALLAGCTRAETQTQVVWEAVPVTVAKVVQKSMPVEIRAIGNVEPSSRVSVKSQVAGEVERVYFQEGQEVRKGDLLFTIDSRPFEAALHQAEATLARDQAEAKLARLQAERYQKLFKEGIASQDQYDRARTSDEAREGAVRADQAAVENAKIQLGYCSIFSPLAGRTGNLMVDQGNVVKANDVSLVVIHQIRPVYVNFSVPERYLAEIKSRMAAGNLKVVADIPGDARGRLQGVLTFVDNAVDTTTGTIHLKGAFTNQDKRLWPGQFVNVVLTLAAQPNAIVVPSRAVQTGQSGEFVFVVKADLTAEMRPIVVSRSLEGEAVVEKGLKPGESVVTDGQLRLVPGGKVQIKNVPETSQAASS